MAPTENSVACLLNFSVWLGNSAAWLKDFVTCLDASATRLGLFVMWPASFVAWLDVSRAQRPDLRRRPPRSPDTPKICAPAGIVPPCGVSQGRPPGPWCSIAGVDSGVDTVSRENASTGRRNRTCRGGFSRPWRSQDGSAPVCRPRMKVP